MHLRLLTPLLLALALGCSAPPRAPAAPARDDDEEQASPKKKAREGDDEGELPSREKGRRTAKVTNQVVRHHRARFRACYDQARKDGLTQGGKVELSFFVLPDGSVKSAEVDEAKSELKDEGLSACLVKTMKSIRFPVADEEVGSRGHYPFDFQAGGS